MASPLRSNPDGSVPTTYLTVKSSDHQGEVCMMPAVASLLFPIVCCRPTVTIECTDIIVLLNPGYLLTWQKKKASQSTKVTAIALLAACKTVGGGSQYVGIQFCMAALGSDARTVDAHSYQDLAAVAVDLLTANVTSTKGKIDSLLRDGAQNAAMVRCLQSCQGMYDGIARGLPGCSAAVKSGKFADATSSLEKSAGDAKVCENGFGKSNVASPVTVEDDNAFQLAKLAVALIRVASD